MNRLKTAVILMVVMALTVGTSVAMAQKPPMPESGTAMKDEVETQNPNVPKEEKTQAGKQNKQVTGQAKTEQIENKRNLKNQLMVKKSTFTYPADVGSRGMRGKSEPRQKLEYYKDKIVMPNKNDLKQFVDKSVYSMKIICVLAQVIEPYKDWGYFGKEMPVVNKNMTAESLISLLNNISQNTTFYHIFTHNFEMPINSEKWLSLKMGQGSDILLVNETKEKPIHQLFDRSPVIDLDVKTFMKKNAEDIYIFLQLNGYFMFEGSGNSNSEKELAILPSGEDTIIVGGKRYFEGTTMENIDVFGNPSESEKVKGIRDSEKS